MMCALSDGADTITEPGGRCNDKSIAPGLHRPAGGADVAAGFDRDRARRTSRLGIGADFL